MEPRITKRWVSKYIRVIDNKWFDVVERSDNLFAWVPSGKDEPECPEDGWHKLDDFINGNIIVDVVKTKADVLYGEGIVDAEFVEVNTEPAEVDTDPNIDISWVRETDGKCYFCGYVETCKHLDRIF